MNHSGATKPIHQNVVMAGVGLASFAGLLLELALTRLFSVVLYYHFAFLAISLAMLGLGAGGVFCFLWRDWLAKWGIRRLSSMISLLNALAVLFALWVTLNTRVFLVLETKSVLRLAALYLSAAIPFFFTGLLLSLVFARQSHNIARLYGADLIGGSLACLAIVPMLNTLGGPNTVLCAAVAMAAAAAVWAGAGVRRRVAMGIAVSLVALLAANHSHILIDVVYAKGQLANDDSTEFSRWNAISRVEVNRWNNDKWIQIDADAATMIVRTDPGEPIAISGAALPNLLRPRGDYAIIGPGGGVDVLGAVASGSQKVVGIEINPTIANVVMRGLYADYSHHLYDLPQVQIHVGEGRAWIRSSQDKFDVIQMTLVDTWASTSAGAFALSENNLYTVEAFNEYFDHLKPDGFIAITRWEFTQPREALRVVSQAIEAFHRMGVDDVRKYFIVVANAQLSASGQQVTVIAKKTPFTIGEERTALRHVQAAPDSFPLYTPFAYGSPEESALCGTLQTPDETAGCIELDLAHMTENRPLPRETVAPFQHLITLPWAGTAGGYGDSPRSAFIRDYPFEIAPVTDDAPFFFFTFKTRQALRALLAGDFLSSIDWKNNIGLAVLGMTLIISVVAVLSFLIGPLAFSKAATKESVTPLLYFVAVGLGYILVEIALIQRFVLFLGHPTYALTVVVFLMLLSSGIGSVASRRWLNETHKVRFVLGVIAGVVMLYVVVLHALLSTWVALPFFSKLLLSASLLLPLGFLMGMPFPTGLRAIASGRATSAGDAVQLHPREAGGMAIEWAWALNAASSVLGSVLAVTLSLHFGLNATLGCAAGAYLLAPAFTLQWRKRQHPLPYVDTTNSEILVPL